MPPHCILCGAKGWDDLDLCVDCVADLPRNTDCCYRCGESFPIKITAAQLCGRCLQKSPQFDETQAPYLYQGSMRYLITQLKFSKQYKNARLLGTLLAKHITRTTDLPECLIPMPLHLNRYRQRGFNQSIELARHLSKQLGIPLDLHNCIRIRDTAQQTSLPAKQRLQNMQQAFKIKQNLSYDHAAIIDDVMTTCASASALASALKQNGVSRVDVWVCARA